MQKFNLGSFLPDYLVIEIQIHIIYNNLQNSNHEIRTWNGLFVL